MGVEPGGLHPSCSGCLRTACRAVDTSVDSMEGLWRHQEKSRLDIAFAHLRSLPAIVMELCECFANMGQPMECDRRIRRHGATQAQKSSVSHSHPARREGIAPYARRAIPGLQGDDANIPAFDQTLPSLRLERPALHCGAARCLVFPLAFDSTWRIAAR